ncbi:MAG TPA: hypothetical protein VKD90_12370 [Gemmataceae bacterium]|nr:hypothetical protein [Gemmataceae bacterium]
MRGTRVPFAVVCVAGMACTVLVVCPRRTPPNPHAAVDHLDADPVVRHRLVRAAARDVVARELIAGRMTLPDAAARFGWLNALPPTTQTRPPEVLAALAGLPAGEKYGEGEALALQVVAWLGRPTLSDDPARAQDAALRQFRQSRAEGRLTLLPEVGEDEGSRLLAEADVVVTRHQSLLGSER